MRAVHRSILLALVLLAPACENGPPWAGGNAPITEDETPDLGAAAYDRRLLFLAPDDAGPRAAVFDFVILSDSLGIRRGVRARVVDGDWRPLMDAGWEMEPMREPWRLVPHGPLTLVVGETGDLGAVIHRDSATRLEIGPVLAEHSPDVSTQLVLRGARLVQGDETVSGVLLDAQLGRAVSPAAVPRAGAIPDTAPDSVAPSPTPIARPGAEALLLDGEGWYAVLATAAGGDLAWIRSAGQDDVREATRLEPTAWSRGSVSTQVPTAWRIVSPTGQLTGELTARATDRLRLQGPGGLEMLAYALVNGWVEDRAARREVFGLVRHVR